MWLLPAIHTPSSVPGFFPTLYIIGDGKNPGREERVCMSLCTSYETKATLYSRIPVYLFIYLFIYLSIYLAYFDRDTRLRAEPSEVRIPEGPRTFFRSPKRPDQLCGPLCIVFNRYHGSFPGLKQAGE